MLRTWIIIDLKELLLYQLLLLFADGHDHIPCSGRLAIDARHIWLTARTFWLRNFNSMSWWNTYHLVASLNVVSDILSFIWISVVDMVLQLMIPYWRRVICCGALSAIILVVRTACWYCIIFILTFHLMFFILKWSNTII